MLILGSLLLGQGARPAPDLARQGWHGNAICYSGYRVGQDPDKQLFPSVGQVKEDMGLLDRNWSLIRLYGSDQHSRDVLEAIRNHGFGIRVMLGIWLSGKPEKQAENARQVANGIQLANEFPELVTAVSVGNEALVSWSDHRMTEAAVIDLVKRVKAAVKCRVTVADDFLYWIQPHNQLARHLDFITLHSYPIWGGQDIDQALPTTLEKFEQIRRAYPGKAVVFGEVGWASYTEPHPQHAPRAGSEAKQKRYYEEVNAWARRNGVTCFLFEAFDEPWKGTGTEGHWGLFTVDRKAKPVMQALYPELKPTGPTSPGYDAPVPKVERPGRQ
jgi:exo-beta-1,3-glucanase (GH17 family)